MKINWTQKLTSRKFWLALAAFVVGVLALFGSDANTTQQISGVIMSLGAVIAYIVGEGLVDSASAGAATITNNFAGSGPVIGTASTDAADTASTGAEQAAGVKQSTALSGSGVIAPDTTDAE
nr:MAG TPA: holin [Caudoviricetes sp.]